MKKKKNRSLFENLDTITPSDSEVSEGKKEIHAFNNWRGLGKTYKFEVNLKKNLPTYMDPVLEIENLLYKKPTGSNLNSLLLNGNIITPLTLSKQKYLIHNTCPIDSI